MTPSGPWSRQQATADTLGEDAPDRHRFRHKKILLTADARALEHANGRLCLDASFRLLARTSAHVSVGLPARFTSLGDRLAGLRSELPRDTDIRVTDTPPLETYDAILNIGGTVLRDLPWTAVTARGWVASVSSDAALDSRMENRNPMSALAAAGLGTAEVFKRLVQLRSGAGRIANGTTFSLASLSDDDDPGTPLPRTLEGSYVQAGGGAIGNGLAWIGSHLPLRGPIYVVDRQVYGIENQGTCLLAGQDTAGVQKAQHLAARMGLHRAAGYTEDLAIFEKRLGRELDHPTHVLGALDSADARRSLQRWWPELLIDGAIGDFMCEVGRHPWSEDVACMECRWGRTPAVDSVALQSRLTGLSIDRIRSAAPSDMVNELDVEAAPRDLRASLKQGLGQPICSLVSDAVLRSISAAESSEGFAPSVPFVAALSASMVMTEFVKSIMKIETRAAPRFQFHTLFGPSLGQFLDETRRRDCVCTLRRETISAIRAHRSASNADRVRTT